MFAIPKVEQIYINDPSLLLTERKEVCAMIESLLEEGPPINTSPIFNQGWQRGVLDVLELLRARGDV